MFRPLRLKSSRAVKKINKIVLMRLEPIEFDGGQRPQIQPVDMRRIDQFALERFIFGNCRYDERTTDICQDLILRTFDHGYEREHEFFGSDG